MRSKFQSLLCENAIVHQVSCPYMREKIGCAKRKHRHIVESRLTLMFNASLLVNYWPYAFLTATFLINRMPVKSLNFPSPWQTLFHLSLDYSILKVFGCACYPWLRPYCKNKLEPRSKQCIVIGYSLNHSGYMCLDPSIRRVYQSHHVMLMKTLFHFNYLLPLHFQNSPLAQLPFHLQPGFNSPLILIYLPW